MLKEVLVLVLFVRLCVLCNGNEDATSHQGSKQVLSVIVPGDMTLWCNSRRGCKYYCRDHLNSLLPHPHLIKYSWFCGAFKSVLLYFSILIRSHF